MARLLVWRVDQPKSGEPEIDVQRYQAGDVIVAVEDGHKFSEREAGDPRWRIVDLPGLSATDVAALVQPDLGFADPSARALNPMLRRRINRLDVVEVLAVLADTGLRQDLAAGRRKVEVLERLTKARPTVRDPRVLGVIRNPRVLG